MKDEVFHSQKLQNKIVLRTRKPGNIKIKANWLHVFIENKNK